MLEEWRECRGVRGEEGIFEDGRALSKLDAWLDVGVVWVQQRCRSGCFVWGRSVGVRFGK